DTVGHVEPFQLRDDELVVGQDPLQVVGGGDGRGLRAGCPRTAGGQGRGGQPATRPRGAGAGGAAPRGGQGGKVQDVACVTAEGGGSHQGGVPGGLLGCVHVVLGRGYSSTAVQRGDGAGQRGQVGVVAAGRSWWSGPVSASAVDPDQRGGGGHG